MALKLVNQAGNALGQYDGYDSEVLTLKGGEVVTFISVVSTTDAAAKDVLDGYINPNKRVVVTRNVATTARPLMLSDDGIQGYGTLFGAVVGGTVGQQVNGPNSYTGAVLGPHTATGSGKVTCWHLPGVYAVSLDAVDTVALAPTVSTLNTGDALTWVPASTTGGQLTKVGSAAAAGNTVVVGRFIDFETNGSLVTTSNSLIGTLNPPDGAFSAGSRSFAFMTFYFNPPAA